MGRFYLTVQIDFRRLFANVMPAGCWIALGGEDPRDGFLGSGYH